MKKLLSIAVASLLIAGTFASCGETETSESKTSESSSSSSSSSEADSSVSEESEEETTAEETSEEATTESEETTEASSEESASTSESATSSESETVEVATVAAPEYKPDTVAETDFVGKWECVKMFSMGQFIEDSLYGIPLNVFVQITVNEDHTGLVGSGMAGSEESSVGFKWEFADNRVNITIEDEEAGMENGGYFYFQDGEFIMSTDDSDELVYFKKVDEFKTMTEEELMSAMGIEPEAFSDESESSDSTAPAADESSAAE